VGIFTGEITEEALAMLAEIEDVRVKAKLLERIGKLAEEPDKQGKPLMDDLIGFRSIRAIGQRNRIIYRIHEGAVMVLVVGAGLRKEGHRSDIYARMTKRFRKK
jgi:mRNA interferase RelE/StbE